MLCAKCGANIPDDSKTCTECGLSIAVPDSRKTGRRILLIAGFASVLVVLSIIGFVVIRNFRPVTSESRFPAVESLLIISGEDEMQIYNGSSKPVTIDGEYSYSRSSMDGKKFVFSIYAANEGYTIYYYDGSKAKELSDDVAAFDISADGNVVGYITAAGTLILYDAATGKSEEVSDDVSDDVLSRFILSPDGKSYAYISDNEIGDNGMNEGCTFYVSVNGQEAEPLDSDLRVVGLSNSAEFIYYLEKDDYEKYKGKLFVRHGKTDQMIGLVDTREGIIFNQDYSEIIYAYNGETYLSKDAGDKEKIADYPVPCMIVPDNTQVIRYYTSMHPYVYNVKSLTGQMYSFHDNVTCKRTIGYLDDEGAFFEIDTIYFNDVLQTEMVKDGKGFYCLSSSGKIKYYIDVTDPDTKKVNIAGDDDIIFLAVSPDPNTVYFVDKYKTLWVKRGTADPTEVADDVISDSLAFTADGKGVYFIYDYSEDDITNIQSGTLGYLSNEKNAKVAEITNDVAYVEASDFGVVYYVYDQETESWRGRVGEAYYAADGQNFTKVMDNAYIPEIGGRIY